MLVYADTSALVKLVLAEPETDALEQWLSAHTVRLMSSDLTRTELMISIRRQNPRRAPDVTALLRRIGFIGLDYSIFDEAGLTAPPQLRSLDAIHLAAVRLLGSQLEGMLTYDERLAEAARGGGIRVFSPA